MEIKPEKENSANRNDSTFLFDHSNLFCDVPVLDDIESAAWDRYSIDEMNIESRLLMGWAGYSLFINLVRESWFDACNHVHILAGTGNNGGDGYVLAWHILSATRKNIIIWQLDKPATKDALYFYELCLSLESSRRIQIHSLKNIHQDTNKWIQKNDLVVDAVFGTGLNKPPSEFLQNIFQLVNSMDYITRISVDIPSGVYADGNFYNHVSFKSDFTYSFGSYKIGQLLEPGILSCGKITVLPIGFFPFDSIMQSGKFFNSPYSRRCMKKSGNIEKSRKTGGHKYTSGVISVLGGSCGMQGAAIMTSKSFLSLGGGLAKIFSPDPMLKNSLAENPELMIHGSSNMESLESEFLQSLEKPGVRKSRTTVAVIGVGLKETLSQNFWKNLLALKNTNVIIDGSGLGQLLPHENLFQKHQLENLVLTPHRAEAEKLLGKSITNTRFAALEISNKYKAHVYLKGPGGILVIFHGKEMNEEIYLNSLHHELSTGGTGDVLCGIIANMLCRYNSAQAIEIALDIYFKAAESVVNSNYNDKDFLTPSEIIHALRFSLQKP